MMKKLLLILLLCSSLSKGFAQTYEYKFANNFNEFNTVGPALNEILTCAAANGSYTSEVITTLGPSCGIGAQTVFSFNLGGGVEFGNNPSFINGTYTINILFKFNAFSGFQRITDFKAGAPSDGLYALDNDLILTGGTTVPGLFTDVTKYYLVTIVRDGAALPNPLVNIYVNGAHVITDLDESAGTLVPTTSTTPIRFFTGDACEDRDGSVKYISLKASTSTPANVLSTWTTLCSSILAVNLTDFSAQKNNMDVLLNWQTTNEINTAYYDVERSYDGQNFTAVGRVNAKNTVSGTYSYNDIAGLASGAGNTYYRLKIVDNNGKIKYSSKVRVSNGKDVRLSVFPNPATDFVTISGVNNKDVVRLLSIDGKVLLQQTVNGQSMILNVGKYNPGTYLIQVKNDREVSQQRFVKY